MYKIFTALMCRRYSFVHQKIVRIMKLTCMLLLMAIVQVNASSYAQKVTIVAKNAQLEDLIMEIQKQSGYDFVYSASLLKNAKPITVSLKGANINTVLDKCVAGQSFTYVINQKTVTIIAAEKPKPIQVKEVVINGKITDEMNLPMPGVSIIVKGTNVVAISDQDGNYQITSKSQNDVLVFSYIGYESQEQTVIGKNIINVKMQAVSEGLGEVIVVGYGTQKKASIIGAISTVSAEQLKAPVAKVSSGLAGKLSGVVAIQRSGEPGSGSTFWIRGISTFGTDSNPLVLVDGIERALDLVDTEDIQEFSILKDAAATAVYGVRGANGVVLVTTKSGIIGKPVVTVKAEQGLLAPTKVPKMINSVQFAEMYNAASGFEYYSPEMINAYKTGSDPDLYPNVNWVEELYKDYSNNRRMNVNVRGGSETAKYYISGGFYNENGLFKIDNMKAYNSTNFYRNYNFRSNIDVKIFEYTTLNVNLSTRFERKNAPGTDVSNIWAYALKTSPNAFPMRYSNGLMSGPGDQQGFNPYSLLTQTGYRESFWNNAQSLFGITQDLGKYVTKGLSANIKASFDAQNFNLHTRSRVVEEWLATGRDQDGNLIMNQKVTGSETLGYTETKSGNRRFYLEASVNYNRSFGKHNFGGLALYQQSQLNYNGVTTSSAAIPYRNQGVAGRVTYDYDNRYFLEGNFGYNGSENFSPGKRFGFFPSAAAGWLVSNEKFFEPLLNVVSMLKFRGSYGEVGNNDIGGGRRFIYLETIRGGDTGEIRFGDKFSKPGITRLGEWPNENVSWETAKKANIGVDLNLFNKLNFQVDYFKENREGIFLARGTIPGYVGITTTPWVNIGKMRNSGIDASVKYNHILGDFKLSGLGNFTFARNIILDQDQPEYEEKYLYGTGQPRWQKFGYVSAGLFRDQADIDAWPTQNVGGQVQPGDIKYLDLNGDGVINTYDRKAIGYTDIPEIVYGFGLSVDWKGFDVSVFLQGNAHSNFLYNSDMSNAFVARNMFESGVYEDIHNNYWTPDNLNAKYPRLTTSSNPNNNQNSTHWLANSSYLRIKNVEVGYSFPKSVTSKLNITGLRVFFSGVNLHTFSNFELWDPDQTVGTVYPQNKVYNLGLSLAF